LITASARYSAKINYRPKLDIQVRGEKDGTLRDPVEGEEEVDAEDVGEHGSVLLNEEDGDAPEDEPAKLQNQRGECCTEKACE
jgi:hypothetical protein